MLYIIFKLLVLAILTLASGHIAQMVGGLLYMLISLTVRIPRIGPYFYKLLDGNIKVLIAIKMVSWAIGMGGIYWGIWLYGAIWGNQFSYYEHWVILIVAGITIVNALHDVLFLNLYDPKDGLNAAREFLPKNEVDLINSSQEIKVKLTFSNIIDMYIPLLIQQLTAMGVFYLSFYHLGFCRLKSSFAVPPNMWECVKYAYSFLPIVKVDNSEVAFEGFYWDICTLVFGVIVFIWTTALLNYVISTFMENSKPQDDTDAKLEVLNTRLEATFQHVFQLYEELKAAARKEPGIKFKPRSKQKKNFK